MANTSGTRHGNRRVSTSPKSPSTVGGDLRGQVLEPAQSDLPPGDAPRFNAQTSQYDLSGVTGLFVQYDLRGVTALYEGMVQPGSLGDPVQQPAQVGGRRITQAARQSGRTNTSAEHGTENVAVPTELLRGARERTGIESDAELVAFALSLLMNTEGEDAFMEELGSLPGHTLDY